MSLAPNLAAPPEKASRKAVFSVFRGVAFSAALLSKGGAGTQYNSRTARQRIAGQNWACGATDQQAHFSILHEKLE
jgi:hypothetical protein